MTDKFDLAFHGSLLVAQDPKGKSTAASPSRVKLLKVPELPILGDDSDGDRPAVKRRRISSVLSCTGEDGHGGDAFVFCQQA